MERWAIVSRFWRRWPALAHPAIGGIFVYAGWIKALHPGRFMEEVDNFHLVSEPWAYWLAGVIPWLEIVAGIAVLFGVGRGGGRLILTTLIVVFLVVVGSAWVRHLNIGCGCFGETTGGAGGLLWAMGRDVAILVGLGWPRGKTKAVVSGGQEIIRRLFCLTKTGPAHETARDSGHKMGTHVTN